MTAEITICMSLMILLAGVLVGIGRVAVVVTTSTIMNPLVSELVAIVVAREREWRERREIDRG
jgi:hypothetical protein